MIYKIIQKTNSKEVFSSTDKDAFKDFLETEKDDLSLFLIQFIGAEGVKPFEINGDFDETKITKYKALRFFRDYEINEDVNIEYEEAAEDDEDFIYMQIINTENNQKLQYAWVPVSLKESINAEIDVTNTTKYHDWTSQLRENTREIYESEKECEEVWQQAIEEINNKYENINFIFETEFEELMGENRWAIYYTAEIDNS